MPRFTYQEFVFFCEAFQTLNHFDFDPEEVLSKHEEGRGRLHIYECLYRDNNNYKTIVELTYDGDDIAWGIGDGWGDADDELSALYDALLILKGEEGSESRIQALIEGSRFDGLTVEQALVSDERGAHLLGVEIRSPGESRSVRMLACHLSSCEFELLRFMIKLEPGRTAYEWESYTPNQPMRLTQSVKVRGNQLVGESMCWYLVYVTDADSYMMLRQQLHK
ncbi:hypothetical protein JI735_34505 (plasmid) [Paenibacillus sonchi]|uniref:Uncharacterized protein n=1 Tax=Paenibacillus sonchi TaxID=373687 RepID=A0A974PJD1_9BACL|nr:hypothetical protein [Paenibacillus sonchi]QQZ64548.1 hypothetical protein JI735_34505 [Paenibacillus sonchi]